MEPGLTVLRIIEGGRNAMETNGLVSVIIPVYNVRPYLEEALDSVLSQTYDNLEILPVGIIPPNPSELVGSKEFATLISSMRSKYDYIIIDCPPFNIVADTQIISEMADRTIFIVRAGLLDKVMLGELEDIYQSGRLTNLSILLNATDMSSSHGGYGYGYRYGYGSYHTYDYYSQK